MNHSFKIGDRVKSLKSWKHLEVSEGDIGTVVSVAKNRLYVELDKFKREEELYPGKFFDMSREISFWHSHLELVK